MNTIKEMDYMEELGERILLCLESDLTLCQ